MFSWRMEGTPPPGAPGPWLAMVRGGHSEEKGKTVNRKTGGRPPSWRGTETAQEPSLGPAWGLGLRDPWCARSDRWALEGARTLGTRSADPTAQSRGASDDRPQLRGGTPAAGDPSTQGGRASRSLRAPRPPAWASWCRRARRARTHVRTRGQPGAGRARVPAVGNSTSTVAQPGRTEALEVPPLLTAGGGRLSPGMQRAGALASGSPG